MGHQTLDASALTAYYAREPGWKRMVQLFAAARDGREPLAIHAANVGEVYYVAYRRAGAARAAEMLAHLRRLPVRIHDRVPLDLLREAGAQHHNALVVNTASISGKSGQPWLSIYSATKLGYPLSTTHVISGGVMGAGATQRFSAVRWGVAGNIVTAWVLTIPAAAIVAGAFYWPVQAIF